MKRLFCYTVLFLLIPKLLFGVVGQISELPPGPWFTGSLLTPAGTTVSQGHVNLEPYLVVGGSKGIYDEHWKIRHSSIFISTSVLVLAQVGITSFMDFQIFPQVVYNHVENQNSVGFSDLPVQLNFQLYNPEKEDWCPSVKLALTELFPTGRYNKLNPEKLETDATGQGSYVTSIGLVFAKTIHFGEAHFLRVRAASIYSLYSAVGVEGFNSFGGGYKTKGKVYPGAQFSTVIGFEYEPVLNWSLALDILGITGKGNRFVAQEGSQRQGLQSAGGSFSLTNNQSATNKSFEQLSLAPALEYNFTANVGVIAGVWFTVLGRNTAEFVNGVVAVNMYF
ncbi:MAG: hypothetical protein HKM07_01170 [Chlamydiae bacterium]|nr:hypothetical protein [Chlamydiota bacterium]